jgi:hypothetical protein
MKLADDFDLTAVYARLFIAVECTLRCRRVVISRIMVCNPVLYLDRHDDHSVPLCATSGPPTFS